MKTFSKKQGYRQIHVCLFNAKLKANSDRGRDQKFLTFSEMEAVQKALEIKKSEQLGTDSSIEFHDLDGNRIGDLEAGIQPEQEKIGHIHLRLPMEKKGRYVQAARSRKMKLAEWLIEVCDRAAEQEQ
jgi:hypothetical protein